VAVIGGCFLFPHDPPVASFTVTKGVDQSDPDNQLVVRLDASGSTDPDGDTIEKYMWAFGEEHVRQVEPLATTMTVHEPVLLVKYEVEVSSDEVTLVVVDSKQAMSDPITKEISVPVPE
jgi:hypothetical protein